MKEERNWIGGRENWRKSTKSLTDEKSKNDFSRKQIC